MANLGAARCRSTLALALLALPLTIAGAQLLSPAALLERAYAPALTRSEALWPDDVDHKSALKPASLPAISGLRKPFKVGDRMLIDSREGSSDALQVVAIEHLDGAGLGLDGVTLQMVTARPEGDPAASSVRFLFAVDAPRPVAKPAHAL